jgi:hypothetical protein
MEKSLYLPFIDNINNIKQTVNRLYIGNETCEHLIPSAPYIEKFLSLNKKGHYKMTFLTPWCTNHGIAKLRSIFKVLPSETEVVFNDWGVLKLIQEHPNLVPVLGRFMITVKRDPRITINSTKINYFKRSNLNNNQFVDYLLENKIYRVELDNVIQLYSFQLPKIIKTSLYLPYVSITSTRKCLLNQNHNFNKTVNCNNLEHCQKISITSMLFEKHKIYIFGNTQYYKNPTLPDNVEKLNIDRLVSFSSLSAKN